MARGLQKIQSQQKANEKNGKKGPTSQIGTAAAGLLVQCVVCKSQLPDPKTYKQHFENKHPKAPMPDELKDIAINSK